MPAEARISPTWKKQKLLVALFLMAFGFYFFFDGAVGWPRSNARFLKHKEFVEAGHPEQWREYARSRGWKEEPPHKLYGRSDIVGQFVFGGLLDLVGALLLAYWATQKNRVLRTDADAVFTPSGTRVPFSAITGLGKKKWDSKGLATVRYEIDGRQGKFIVDDYKFEAEPTRAILTEIEERLVSRSV